MQAGWLRLFTKELSDKWQIPTFVLSIALAGAGVYTLFSNQKHTSTAECIELCEKLMADKDYSQASKLGLELLKEPDLTQEQQNTINNLLARLIYETELPLQKHDPKRLKKFEYYFNKSIAKRTLTNSEHMMLADIRQWDAKYQKSIEHINILLENDVPNRTLLLRRKLELLPKTSNGNVDDEYAQTLNELLSRDDLPEADLVWAIDAKTELLFKKDKFRTAVEIIAEVLPKIKDARNQLQLQYSLALGEFSQGKSDIAEPTLRSILGELSTRDELEAKVTLLLGKICEQNDRPEEAIAFFRELITYHTYTEYHLAAVLGKAKSCAILHRYADAKSDFEHSRSLLEAIGPNKLVNNEDITSAIETTSDFLYRHGEIEQALLFAHMHYDYLDPDDERNRQVLLARLGSWHSLLAEKIENRLKLVGDQKLSQQLHDQMIENYEQAGDAYLKLSDSPGLLDKNAASVLWKSASCYEKAERPVESLRLLERFVEHWPNSPELPAAMYKLARTYQAENKFMQAAKYFQRLIDEYRRTPSGLKSPVALAECQFAIGPDYYEKAESILREIVDDSSRQNLFTPASLEFRKAMFLLGKIYYFQGNYDSCVARLEEALQRDPENEAGPEARFIIAQSYRKISEGLQIQISETADRVMKNQLSRGWEKNLERAKNLYKQATVIFENTPNRTPLQQSYLKLSCIYYADSLYDLAKYKQAIEAYEGVIDRYEKTPIALSSYVQIANAYQRMGEYGKIKAVLERMKWLMKHLPDSAFAQPEEPFSRADWERWIDWNYKSGVLEYKSDVLTKDSRQTSAF